MIFLNRTAEMERLDRLAKLEGGGLAVVYGRRLFDGQRLLLGEVKWSSKPFSARGLARARAELGARPRPTLPSRFDRHEAIRVLFVPELAGPKPDGGEPWVVTAGDLLHPVPLAERRARAENPAP